MQEVEEDIQGICELVRWLARRAPRGQAVQKVEFGNRLAVLRASQNATPTSANRARFQAWNLGHGSRMGGSG
jgi:hypothetical protein